MSAPTVLRPAAAAVPEDRALSPCTGWTRRHWEATADDLLLAVRPHASPTHALVTPPGAPGGYGRAVDGLEGFARTFMAAGFRLAGEGGADPLDLAGWYAQGLAAGTDPTSPERWTRPDEHGQAKVEAAALALALHLTRPWIWDRLDPGVQERTVDYLATVVGADYPPINWVWFRIVVEQFLRSVGGPWSRDDLEHDLALHDTFTREGGWYSDGAERAYDHYAGWALHLYPVLWLQMAGDDPLATARRGRYLAHLDRFLHDAVRLVGADGSPLLQGRSLVYRYAAAAPFWAGALAGSTALGPGRLRRAASGIVRHFTDAGVPGPDGLLTLGWHDAWRPMAQSYSGPGSPYWASKGLLGLALPADHPVWTAVEEPLPLELGDDMRTAAAPGWLVSGTRDDGLVRVVNHGCDHALPGSEVSDSPLYARLGYSTATAPLMAGNHAADPLDSSVVVLDEDGLPSHRAGFTTLTVRALGEGDGTPAALLGASRWRAHWVEPDPTAPGHGSGHAGTTRRGPWVTAVSVVRHHWEVRLARVDLAPRSDVVNGVLRLGGWAVGVGEEHGTRFDSSTACSGRLVSAVHDLAGLPLATVHAVLDATPLSVLTAVPERRTAAAAEPGRWYAAAVLLAGRRARPGGPPVLTLHTAAAAGPAATVGWPDGTHSRFSLPHDVPGSGDCPVPSPHHPTKEFQR
ncbi:hypothetical protein CLV92_11471 [Kineococcus xinjiangensis]|uniref:DUF2264 domain-containing protein n=1 Tax=Kineococcus xinjiangensis TaxID=512762 RepID=A0A2S6IE84_9ACTN|nr:DUF2264 domain-containing protein [Kineococcus xinjiangensis]PPK92470.1 hypothetical protein CLV92_11471 [Kineococcus xinjiangensis]